METLPTSECVNTKTDEIKMTMAVRAYRRDPVLVICYGLLYKKKSPFSPAKWEITITAVREDRKIGGPSCLPLCSSSLLSVGWVKRQQDIWEDRWLKPES